MKSEKYQKRYTSEFKEEAVRTSLVHPVGPNRTDFFPL
jgi:hypothetical protein